MQNPVLNISNMRELHANNNPFSRLTCECRIKRTTQSFIVGLLHTEGKHTGGKKAA